MLGPRGLAIDKRDGLPGLDCDARLLEIVGPIVMVLLVNAVD